MTIHIMLAAGVLACLAFIAFLGNRSQKTMTTLEDLQSSFAHLKEANTKLKGFVDSLPTRIPEILTAYFAANPPGEGESAGSVPDAALIELSRALRDEARFVASNVDVGALFIDNQIAHGDPQGGALTPIKTAERGE